MSSKNCLRSSTEKVISFAQNSPIEMRVLEMRSMRDWSCWMSICQPTSKSTVFYATQREEIVSVNSL